MEKRAVLVQGLCYEVLRSLLVSFSLLFCQVPVRLSQDGKRPSTGHDICTPNHNCNSEHRNLKHTRPHDVACKLPCARERERERENETDLTLGSLAGRVYSTPISTRTEQQYGMPALSALRLSVLKYFSVSYRRKCWAPQSLAAQGGSVYGISARSGAA